MARFKTMMGRKFPCLLEAPGKQASVFICGKWMKSSFFFGKVEKVRCGSYYKGKLRRASCHSERRAQRIIKEPKPRDSVKFWRKNLPKTSGR